LERMNLSRKEVLPAQELGTEARRIVSRKGSAGKILASLSGGVYFLTDDQEIFWVYPDSSPMHRRCIRTAFLPESCRFQPEQRFRIEPCLIRGDSFGVDLRGAKEWNPLLPEQVLPAASVKGNCEQLIKFLRCLNSRSGLSPLIPSLWLQGNQEFELSRATDIFFKIFPAIFEIAQACRERDLSGILEKGRGLIGLGPGLTPSGDDFMGGLLFSVSLLQKLYPEAFSRDPDRLTEFLTRAQSQTHPLSYVFLSDLASGHAPAPLGEIINFLLQGRDFERALSAAGQLLRFGHSTGGDMLAGMMAGMLMVSNRDFVGGQLAAPNSF